MNKSLAGMPPVTAVFPPCSELLLALINTGSQPGSSNDMPLADNEDTLFFKDYFTFDRHTTFAGEINSILDPQLIACTSRSELISLWSSCLPAPCVRLLGNRQDPAITDSTLKIRRLSIADLVWLFYFERLGIFQILGVILDDFAGQGKIPISNGVVNPSPRKDLTAVILETMIRQIKMGISSTVRDRNSSYRRCLGWSSEAGRKLGMDTAVNTAFDNLFHKLIHTGLGFFDAKRLAVAIQASTSPGRPSVATLITIRDNINVLKKSFDAFAYGRNYTNALNGIVWCIAGMSIIKELRTTIGIPAEYDQPYEFIPAAYDLLVMNKAITPSENNRYQLHKDCANNARDILLDLEVLNHQDAKPGGELEQWLDLVENKFEGYRTAYRNLTGVDLGTTDSPVIEQKA